MPGPERRGRAWAPPPLERHRVERGPPVTPAPHVDRVLGKRAQGRSAPELRGVGRRRRLGHDRPGPQHGVAVTKERVRVRDPVVAARDHEDAFTLLGLEGANREAEPADRGPGEILEQGARVCRIARPGPTGRPEHTVAQFGAAQRCVGDDRAGGGLEPVAARLEDRATGKFRRAIPQHGPVRELARRGPTGAERVEHARAAAPREGVEVWRVGSLVGGAPSVLGVTAVTEPVKQQDEERAHGRRGGCR